MLVVLRILADKLHNFLTSEPNDWTMQEMVEGTMNFYDNTNVWLWKLGPEDQPEEGQYLAVTDWPQVHEVDPHTLAITVGSTILFLLNKILLRPNTGSVSQRVSPWQAQPTGDARLGRTRRCSTT